MTAPAGGRWTDLQTRLISAVVMLVAGGLAIWLGGATFAGLVVALTALMIWELSRMMRPGEGRVALWLAVLTAAALLIVLVFGGRFSPLILLSVPLAIAVIAVPDRLQFCLYAALIVLAGYGLVVLRDSTGATAILWLVGVVAASDILGYFAGRRFGGPKFWPAISPKKTWSGTVAGWLGASLVGIGFVVFANAGWGLVVLSAVVAFAGQLGDIAESWIKRRAAVKDSSTLIPGHGGVLDRFDALIAAVALVMVLGLILPLPLPGGN